MNNTKIQTNNYRFIGPWVIMVIIPWLFPIILIVLLLAAVVRGSIEPLKTVHFWFLFSIIGLAIYVGIDFWIGIQVREVIGSIGV